MTAEDFDCFLRRRWCWVDGTPTHASSARQRQCPHCRRKWSYDRQLVRWKAALAFACDKSRGTCAKELGIDIHTAGKIYAAMEGRLVEYFAAQLRTSAAGDVANGEEMMRLWRRSRSLRSAAAIRRHFVRLGLRRLEIRERVDLVFQLCFRDELRRKVGMRLSTARAKQPWKGA